MTIAIHLALTMLAHVPLPSNGICPHTRVEVAEKNKLIRYRDSLNLGINLFVERDFIFVYFRKCGYVKAEKGNLSARSARLKEKLKESKLTC